MAHPLLHSAFRRLLGQIAREGSGEMSDGMLLEKFSSGHDAQAFAELVRRHGPMVLGVCRRVLHDGHEAEDACQATFLVLARKAAGLRRDRSLSNWLYTVAHNLAVNARVSSARRRAHEKEAAIMVERQADDVAGLPELRAVLDAELSLLPAKYREPLVLCYLEGMTHEAAARALGWPSGSMAKRLDHACALLRQRLTRRGIGVSTALLSTLFAETARADMPPALLDQISAAATAFALGGGSATTLISARTAAYAEGILHTMTMTKLKVAAALLMCLGILGTGAGLLAQHVLADPSAAVEAAPAAANMPPARPAAEAPPAAAVVEGEPLPAGAVGRLGALHFRQRGAYVFGLTFSSDGKMAASACEDGLIHLWDCATGREIKQWQGAGSVRQVQENMNTTVIMHLAFSPDGRQLAAAGSVFGAGAWIVTLWDVATAQRLHQFQGTLFKYPIAAFSADGKTLTTWNKAGSGLSFWDTATGKETRGLHCPDADSVVFAADDRYLATLSPEPKEGASSNHLPVVVTIYDWATGKRVHQSNVTLGPRNSGFITGVFSPDSRLLALTPGGRSIHVIETLTGKERRQVRAPGVIYQLFSAGRLLAASCLPEDEDSPKVRMWNWATGEPDKALLVREELGIPQVATPESPLAQGGTLPPGMGNPEEQPIVPRELLYCATASPRGNVVAFGGLGYGIRLWDTATGKRLHQGDGHQWPVQVVAYSPDGKVLATGGADRLIKIWDAASRKLLRQYLGHSRPVTFLTFTPDGQRLLSGALGEANFCSWDLLDDKAARPERMALSTAEDAPLLAGRFAFSAADGVVAVSTFAPVKPLLNGQVRDDAPVSRVRLYDLKGRLVRTLPVLVAAEAALAFSADGATLAVALPSGSVALVDARTGKEQLTLKIIRAAQDNFALSGRSTIHGLQFAPDGKVLAVLHGQYNNAFAVDPVGSSIVGLWDLTAGKELHQLDAHEAAICSFAFAPDGKLLATVSGERTLRLWEAATGKHRGCVPGHHGTVYAAAFAPDGATVATASHDTTVLLWIVNDLLQRKGTAAIDLERAWTDLASDQVEKVDESIGQLVSRPKEAVALLARRARPLRLADAQQKEIGAALADLGSPNFAARQKASETLEKLGELAESALRSALDAKPALEMQQRLETILAKLQEKLATAEPLKILRAIEVLEHIDSPEARQVLRDLAQGLPEARRTREAEAALRRLERERK